MFGLTAAPEIAIAVPSVMPNALLASPFAGTVAIFVARAEAQIGAAAVQRADRERFCFALLPRQPIGRYHIERDIEDVKQAGERALRAWRPQFVDAEYCP